MFVVMYDLSDMPPNHRTFLRQRTMYVPLASNTDTSSNINNNSNDNDNERSNNSKTQDLKLKSYLRYLIHLR